MAIDALSDSRPHTRAIGYVLICLNFVNFFCFIFNNHCTFLFLQFSQENNILQSLSKLIDSQFGLKLNLSLLSLNQGLYTR